MRRCKYCRKDLEEGRKNKRYCGSGCRARASEDRKDPENARSRSRAAQTRRSTRPPDLRISYRRAVGAVAEYLAAHDCGNEPTGIKQTFATADASTILRPLLTDRQLAALSTTTATAGRGAPTESPAEAAA